MVEQRVVVPLARVQFPLATQSKNIPGSRGYFYLLNKKAPYSAPKNDFLLPAH